MCMHSYVQRQLRVYTVIMIGESLTNHISINSGETRNATLEFSRTNIT